MSLRDAHQVWHPRPSGLGVVDEHESAERAVVLGEGPGTAAGVGVADGVSASEPSRSRRRARSSSLASFITLLARSRAAPRGRPACAAGWPDRREKSSSVVIFPIQWTPGACGRARMILRRISSVWLRLSASTTAGSASRRTPDRPAARARRQISRRRVRRFRKSYSNGSWR